MTVSYERNLKLLARYCGLQRSYFDIWGIKHEATTDDLVRVLQSMRIPASTPEACQEAIGDIRRALQHQLIQPVKVVTSGSEPVAFVLTAEQRLADKVSWKLFLEQGGELSGEELSSKLRILRKLPNGYVRLLWRGLANLPEGYHTLQVQLSNDVRGSCQVIVCPKRCHSISDAGAETRHWGISAQLYSVSSKENPLIGDYRDLLAFANGCAELGASTLGVNPLHARRFFYPEDCSPYSPTSRKHFDVLSLNVESIEELDKTTSQPVRVSKTSGNLVDYEAVWQKKIPIYESLYERFTNYELRANTPRAKKFQAFSETRGRTLQDYATFETLEEYFREQGNPGGFRSWPSEYQNPRSSEVLEFARSRQKRVDFFKYLQWQAEEQLEKFRTPHLRAQLPLGLYLDLALGCSGLGADIWSEPLLYADGASMGAPPDELNLKGQDWGLPPFIPRTLRAHAYLPFRQALQATMRYAGVLRIDHVMSLVRVLWIPHGLDARSGVYVRYPLRDLMGILALESKRNKVVVVGEDLGTVPEEMRRAMDSYGVLSYKVLYFMKNSAEEFQSPEDYPERALVTSTTHDLPTLRGFWANTDNELRRTLGLFPRSDMYGEFCERRDCEKSALLKALAACDLYSGEPGREMDFLLTLQIQRFLARTPCELCIVPVEDIIEQLDQVNLPGVVDEYPSWRQRISLSLEELLADDRLRSLSQALRDEGRAHQGYGDKFACFQK